MSELSYIKASDGEKIFYHTKGHGQPIVFIHGWSSNGEQSFGKIAEALSDEFQCIFVDLRGHGASTSYNSISINRLVEDLNDLILELNLQNVILVGHSLGGLIIYAYFEQYSSERISGVAVLDMSPKVLCDASWNHGLCIANSPHESIADYIHQTIFSDFIMMTNWYFKTITSLNNVFSPIPYESMLYLLWLDMLDSDYRDGAQKISVPLIYFYTDNGLYPSSVNKWLSENVHCSYKGVDMQPCNHFTILSETKKIVSEIRNTFTK